MLLGAMLARMDGPSAGDKALQGRFKSNNIQYSNVYPDSVTMNIEISVSVLHMTFLRKLIRVGRNTNDRKEKISNPNKLESMPYVTCFLLAWVGMGIGCLSHYLTYPIALVESSLSKYLKLYFRFLTPIPLLDGCRHNRVIYYP